MLYNMERGDVNLKLKDFTKKFIPNGTKVTLYTLNPNKPDTKVWEGMDWQIPFSYKGSDYFRLHPEVLPCPYSDNNVISVKDGSIYPSKRMSLIIELPKETKKDNQKSSILENKLARIKEEMDNLYLEAECNEKLSSLFLDPVGVAFSKGKMRAIEQIKRLLEK